MYICSTEEVVTDKGCGHRLPPWLVFLLDSFLPAHSYQTLLHPLEACSIPRVPVLLPSSPAPRLHAQHRLASEAGSSRAALPGDGDGRLCFGLLPAQTLDRVPGSCSGPSELVTAGAEERLLLPPRHGSPGCFQASPLYSPCPVLCLCACSAAVTSLAVSRLRVVFWGHPSHKAGARGAVLVLMRQARGPASRAGLLPPPRADPSSALGHR